MTTIYVSGHLLFRHIFSCFIRPVLKGVLPGRRRELAACIDRSEGGVFKSYLSPPSWAQGCRHTKTAVFSHLRTQWTHCLWWRIQTFKGKQSCFIIAKYRKSPFCPAVWRTSLPSHVFRWRCNALPTFSETRRNHFALREKRSLLIIVPFIPALLQRLCAFGSK